MFKSIVKQIREAGHYAEILTSIDFSQMQQQLLMIASLILSRDQEYSREDTLITRSVLDLWTVSVISNPEIKKDFYNWSKEPDQVVLAKGETTEVGKILKKQVKRLLITNSTELILGGLFSNKGQTVRKKFQETIEMLGERVDESKTSERPLFWFLNLLIDKSPVWDGTEENKALCKDSQEFFATVTGLLIQYKEEFLTKEKIEAGVQQQINFEQLVQSTIEKMKSH